MVGNVGASLFQTLEDTLFIHRMKPNQIMLDRSAFATAPVCDCT
ncbi:hypothetical protein SCARR_04162 [Pontiella sulfatireligans]|uniref:Uncharacterized protein n=1 Tax=Pontiella sulfatireligans TaxID=2750658 RepID=A0A6C2US56_9BACT|nr:hypothetical protein SCARR_04162 [Pontiella sulfatireligans]